MGLGVGFDLLFQFLEVGGELPDALARPLFCHIVVDCCDALAVLRVGV